MFEFTAPPEAPPDFGPADADGCAEPFDDDTRGLLDGLAATYAAMPAAGVLPFAVEELPPGPHLAGVVATFDADSADGWSLLEAAAVVERLAAWVAAKQAAVLTALASRPELQPTAGTGYRSVNPITNTAVEVAARCQLTAKQAEGLVGHAVQLVRDFPDTWAALLAGVIDMRRVRAITDELGGQEVHVRRRVESTVLPRAPFLDSVALRKLIRQLLHELAPVEAAERHAIARDSRYVAVTPASDGMAFVEARLPAEDATALDAALNASAADMRRADAAAGGPCRTKDQRRADALAELGWAALATPSSDGGSPSRNVSVHVTLPFGSLAGLSDEPGELDGYGPIPAQAARTLAAEGVWTWLTTDPGTGQLLDLGRTKYRPTKALADFVAARDRTCRMPGCHRRSRAGDIDHIVPFGAGGGTTCAANCHALCETHHLLKHHGNWTVTRQPDGTTRWRSPTGHTYERPPERIGPVNGPAPPERGHVTPRKPGSGSPN